LFAIADPRAAWSVLRGATKARLAAPLRKPFARYVRAFAAMMAGLALGFLATAVSIHSGHGFNALRVGPWTAWPQTGGPGIDPYARAILAHSGEAPLGRDEGLVFVASADSAGARLDGRCEYRITPPVPAARFWTLGLASPAGALLPNPTRRYAYGSRDILRREGGAFEIAISRAARPGNWLTPGEARDVVLVLRLYETALDVEARHDPESFPNIVKLACP
jgi:hypothetical protein